MKICAVIAEYNPLHNGHLRQLRYIKEELKAEKTVIIMSGNFTQRGEPAILNKYERARQAILAGADLVIELPTVFATANAETFANGAVNILNGLGVIDGLCFGVESGEKQEYIDLAYAMNDESKQFRKKLKENLEKGYSLAKSKFETVKEMGGKYDEKLISSPNNVLALEYTKAILKTDSNMEIYPLTRSGDHNDNILRKGITSAKSIREALKLGRIRKVKKSVPLFTYLKLKKPVSFESCILGRLITTDEAELSEVPDCTEGLENRLKALIKDNLTWESFLSKAVTKRYTESRIKRILTANFLGIKRDLVADCLTNPLYAKVLAVKKSELGLLSGISENSTIPLITRKSDLSKLKSTGKKCFNVDVTANDVYNLITGVKTNENYTEMV